MPNPGVQAPADQAPAEQAAAVEAAAWAELRRLWQGQPADGAHDLGHVQRVLTQCRHIAQGEGGADELVLIPAAILHDAVNLPKSHPDRAGAAQRSAEAAAGFLAALDGYPPDRIAAVGHAIAAHSFSAGLEPQTREARILQDADRLEALGALGLARLFHVAGQMGAALFDAADPLAQHRAADDRRFALDHIELKLLPVARGLQTATGRHIAAKRVAFLLQFRAQLLQEIG